MSVDPDDTTPAAIRAASDEVTFMGTGSAGSHVYAYQNNRAIMGLPGCVMYAGRTIFDLVLPRVLLAKDCQSVIWLWGRRLLSEL